MNRDPNGGPLPRKPRRTTRPTKAERLAAAAAAIQATDIPVVPPPDCLDAITAAVRGLLAHYPDASSACVVLTFPHPWHGALMIPVRRPEGGAG